MHASDSEIDVWCRLDGSGTVTVNAGSSSASASLGASTNYTGVVRVGGLSPGTAYEYTVDVDGVESSGPHAFWTMPKEGEPGYFEFIHESDYHDDHEVYEQVWAYRRQFLDRPIFSVCGGDYEIVKELNPAETPSDHLAGWRLNIEGSRDPSTYPDKQAFRAITPFYRTWDDWDSFGNNTYGLNPDYSEELLNERARFWREEEQAGGPPYVDGRAVYRSFRVADCLFVLTDERTYSEGAIGHGVGSYDAQTAKRLGDAQKNWLIATLQANRDAPFKFVLLGTSQPDNNALDRRPPGHPISRDSTGMYYRLERNEIVQAIEADPLLRGTVYYLTGDDHEAVVRLVDSWREPQDDVHTGIPMSTPVVSRQEVVEVKVGIEAGGIGTPWRGSPFERFYTGRQRTIGHWRVNTRVTPPALSCEIISMGASFDPAADEFIGETLYRFSALGSTVYLPKDIGNEGFPLDYSLPSPPGDSYSKDSFPSSPYAEDSGPSSAYSGDPAPASSFTGQPSPSTGYSAEAGPSTSFSEESSGPSSFSPDSAPSSIYVVQGLDDVLENGSFETGESPWDFNSFATRTNVQAYLGSWSAFLNGRTSPANPSGKIEQAVTLIPGKTYLPSVWLLLLGVAQTLDYWIDPGSGSFDHTLSVVGNADDWSQGIWDPVAAVGTNGRIMVFVSGAIDSGGYFVDAVSLLVSGNDYATPPSPGTAWS